MSLGGSATVEMAAPAHPFEGAGSADLDEEARRRIAAAAIPVPEGVTKGEAQAELASLATCSRRLR